MRTQADPGMIINEFCKALKSSSVDCAVVVVHGKIKKIVSILYFSAGVGYMFSLTRQILILSILLILSKFLVFSDPGEMRRNFTKLNKGTGLTRQAGQAGFEL